jgi:4-amino-4-deoxy-L-arabinose transferase-like glycosyltransferase
VIWLDAMPVNLSNDEISIAYDSYSVSKTLRDEHDHFLPISFQSHNTYKAPLTIYLSIPFIKIFGNNDYGIRLLSVITGTLTVVFLGLLVYELTKNKFLSLIASMTLAITPWHIYTSRMILEANIALFFVVLGVYLFYRAITKQSKLIFSFSFVSFCLSMYAYHTEWVFTPLLILGLILINFKRIKDKEFIICGFIAFILLSSPLFVDAVIFPSATRRSSSEFFLNDLSIHNYLSNRSYNVFQKSAIIVKRVFDNYSQYLNLGNLFFNGLDLNVFLSDYRMRIVNPPIPVGLFLFTFLPFFFLGLINIKNIFKENYKYILIWAVLSPLVPALTLGGVNSVRYLVAVAPFSIIIAGGFWIFWRKFESRFIRILVIVIIFLSFIYVAFSYFQYGVGSRYNYLYNYKEITNYIKSNYNKYDRIVVDSKFGDDYDLYGVPHLYIGFYDKIDPAVFLKTKRTDSTSLYFDKFETTSIDWVKEASKSGEPIKSLLIAPISNHPKDILKAKFNVLKVIYFPNNSPAFYIYTLK